MRYLLICVIYCNLCRYPQSILHLTPIIICRNCVHLSQYSSIVRFTIICEIITGITGAYRKVRIGYTKKKQKKLLT